MMHSSKTDALVGLATLAVLGLAAPHPAQAQIVLSGHYDDVPLDATFFGIGYDIPSTSADTYIVTPSATFNGNGLTGLYGDNENAATLIIDGGQFNSNTLNGVDGSARSITVNGGQFNGNGQQGIIYGLGSGFNAEADSLIINGGQFNGNNGNGLSSMVVDRISGGQFEHNKSVSSGTYVLGGNGFDGSANIFDGQFDDNDAAGWAADSGASIVQGGEFAHNAVGVDVPFNYNAVGVFGGRFINNAVGIETSSYQLGPVLESSSASIEGGQFGGNQTDFAAAGGKIDLYGQFDNPLTGKPMTIGDKLVLPQSSLGVTVYINGTLYLNNGPSQTYSYSATNNGTITLIDTGVAPAGSSQAHPILPVTTVSASDGSTTFVFSGVKSGSWVDPATTSAFRLTMTDESLFTGIMGFPSGFLGGFDVTAGGKDYGLFLPGETLTFGGTGVSSFLIFGITPSVDGSSPTAFPLLLTFSTAAGSFTVAAAPEPSQFTGLGLGALSLAGLTLRARRRKAA